MVDTWEALHNGPPGNAVRAKDNGFHVLIAWLVAEVNPQMVSVLPVEDELYQVTDECVDRDGTVTRTRRLVTPDELEEVAEGIDEYLREAGVPPLPRGLGAYLRLPNGMDDIEQLDELLLGDTSQSNTDTPAQMAAALRPALRERYRGGRFLSATDNEPTSPGPPVTWPNGV